MNKSQRNTYSLLKKSTLWIALSLSLLGNAQALTLSSPVVQSKQGEALRVEIDLSEISLAEQVGFQANLATQSLYKALKVDIPSSNGEPLDVQIQLLRRDNGQLYLKVTSTQVVDGNVVNLLIDMRWATGRLLRDLSLSLDSVKNTGKNKPITPPALAENKIVSTDTDKRIAVKRGDTASKLVAGDTPEGVSLEQMLIALLRSNPDAFIDSNVNRMKEGALLTLPSENQAQAIPREDARREIRIQAKDFETYRAELAARAAGGVTPKVARDAEGKLEAKIQNNNTKTNPDKLTLTKPGKKDSGNEEKIAQQREAQDVAARAAELSRNIAELGKIAATSASQATSGELSIDVAASAASANGEWLSELLENTLTPIGAVSLIALLAILGLWRRRANQGDQDDAEDFPSLDVKFDMDLPERKPPHIDHDDVQEDHKNKDTHSAPPKMEMPNISLDLNDTAPDASSFQVRIDLAEELWNLGQLHTGRALMEEVANEASGADKEKALKWLAERG